jgi:hypothetical protein
MATYILPLVPWIRRLYRESYLVHRFCLSAFQAHELAGHAQQSMPAGPHRQHFLSTRGDAGDAIVPVTAMRVIKAKRVLVYFTYFIRSNAGGGVRTGEGGVLMIIDLRVGI